jgi:hypothetical protein
VRGVRIGLAICVLGASALLGTVGCKPGGIGDPCIPEDEYTENFSGFALGEVNVETRSLQCESRVCLVNHFRGRVSCPHGQTEADLALDPGAPERCRIPGTDGSQLTDAVSVPVPARQPERDPDAAVYCSCRCDGPDPEARYRKCPSGFACEPLIDDLSLGFDRQLIGSYCIRRGTRFDETAAAGRDCRSDPLQEGCPDDPLVNP